MQHSAELMHSQVMSSFLSSSRQQIQQGQNHFGGQLLMMPLPGIADVHRGQALHVDLCLYTSYLHRGKALHLPASLYKANLMVVVHQLLEAGAQNVMVLLLLLPLVFPGARRYMCQHHCTRPTSW
jgi:hypothetical protein